MVDVRPTDDFGTIRNLGVAAGLDDSDRGHEQVVAMWGAFDGERQVGGIVLEVFQGIHAVNWMSVADEHRGRGIGRRLLAVLEDEARRRHIGALWATARAPGFYLAHGYLPVETGDERESLLCECSGCPQFDVTCHPQAVVKDIAGESHNP